MANESNKPDLMRYATAGIEFVTIFGVCLLGGFLLDRKLNLLPLFTIIGVMVGFAAGLYRLVKSTSPLRKGDGETKDSLK